jgi:hypothetical protein
MKKLWIFGDSLSTGFNDWLPNKMFSDEITWPHLLSNNINYQCVNLAKPGYGLAEILHSWLLNWNDIDIDDLVIIQLGFETRYNLIPLNISTYELNANIIPSNFEELFNVYYKNIVDKCILKWGNKLNIYFWNVKSDWYPFNHIKNKLYSPIGTPGLYEGFLTDNPTYQNLDNNNNSDGHFNELSHIKVAESFYKQIFDNFKYFSYI